jgi:regulator of protease activity HflC (stomatin/prohibitin superfamily)
MKMFSKLFVVFCMCLVMVGCGCTRIDPGHVGIKISMSGDQKGVSDMPLLTGWQFYVPTLTKIFEYPTYMQTAQLSMSQHEGRNVDDSINFTDKDQMPINADVNLSFNINPTKIPAFYVTFRNDNIDVFTYGYLKNVIRDAFTVTTPGYSYEEINGLKRDEILVKVKTKINDDVGRFGVEVKQFGFIGALRPPREISEAISLKVKAKQTAQQRESELREAVAAAAKIVAKAEGDAKANEALGRSITPALLQWKQLEIQTTLASRWNGVRPTVESGGGTGLMLQLPVGK